MPVPVTRKADANLIEVFSSIQGEGTLVGYRQVFVRFAECNLDCNYCDTDFAPAATCRVEKSPGSGENITIENPVGLARLCKLITSWCKQLPDAHHSISLTGGEPLLQCRTLLDWLPEMRRLLPIYLETNGTLPDQLEMVLPHIDWVSMDIKLNSLTGSATDWEVHRRFLQLANKTDCYVKMVVADATPDLELQMAAELVSDVSSEIPLILQPVTIDNNIAVSTGRLLEMQGLVSALHGNVRIIPQTHRFLGVL